MGLKKYFSTKKLNIRSENELLNSKREVLTSVLTELLLIRQELFDKQEWNAPMDVIVTYIEKSQPSIPIKITHLIQQVADSLNVKKDINIIHRLDICTQKSGYPAFNEEIGKWSIEGLDAAIRIVKNILEE